MTSGKGNQRSPKRTQQARRPWLPLVATLSTFALLAGGLAAAYLYLSQPGRMPLRVVEVSGEFRHLSRAAIQQTAGAAIDGGFFSCDMQRLRNAVLAMPWVADVSVRRIWPDRLNMRVTERQPLARWGGDALVSTDAKVFRPRDLGEYADLVKLDGPAGSAPRVVAFFQAALPVARTRGLEIRAIELDERRHWWLRFAEGLTVSLGREARDARLSQFLRVYPQLIADPQRRPERVDMRYTHGFAVRWRDVQVEPAAEKNPQEKV